MGVVLTKRRAAQYLGLGEEDCKMRKLQIALLAALVVGLLAVPNLVFATNCAVDTCLELTFSDGMGHTFDSGLSASPINVTNLSLGNFMITAQGTGLPTFSLPNLLDLFNLAITSANGGTLSIALTEVNIPQPIGTSIFQSSIGGSQSPGSTLDYITCMDAANHNGTTYGCGAGTTKFGQFHFTGTSYSADSNAKGTTTGLYSVTQLVTLVMGANSITSFDAHDKIPEPAALSVLGFSLFALGTKLRMKFQGA